MRLSSCTQAALQGDSQPELQAESLAALKVDSQAELTLPCIGRPSAYIYVS